LFSAGPCEALGAHPVQVDLLMAFYRSLALAPSATLQLGRRAGGVGGSGVVVGLEEEVWVVEVWVVEWGVVAWEVPMVQGPSVVEGWEGLGCGAMPAPAVLVWEALGGRLWWVRV